MREASGFEFTAERWRRLEEIFHATLDLHGDNREDFINRTTANDPELQRELRAMLLHSDKAEEQIASAIERITRRAVGANDWAGRRFGPYRIVREIGRGGMGLVFEASRDDAEYDKTVALKIAPDWRDINRLRERFRNERQILARLEHPNIARFLDGGTENGVPYFAMEYIDGKPITEWVRERNLSVRERINLFLRICAAVHYAHENLVVHRDLKPSNILVDRNDTPKLLDFGIATLLNPAYEEATATTTGLRLWTPDYTSPEQVRGGAVTVRTDIYSLGLILYELLCGERAQVADLSSPLTLDRSICETEPAPPSARAAARGDNSLSRQLRGDLDTIVAMAIRKEPQRRYGSAAALGSDLARFLNGRTVEARPSTARYRISKWMRRHWLAAAAAALVIVSVAGGVASTLYQARRAERRFEQVRTLANAFVFDVHDRIQNLPGSTEARKVIVSTALRYLENLRQDAGNDTTLLGELAAAYEKIGDVQGKPDSSNLGDSQGALASYRRAESILKPLASRGDPDATFALLSAVYKIGSLQHVLGEPSGVQQLESARERARALVAKRPTDLATLELAAKINADLARLYSDAFTPQPSRDAAEEATALAERMVAVNPSSEKSLDFLAESKNSLAMAYRPAGDLELAAKTYRESLTIRQRLVEEHPENTSYRRLLLITYGHLGDVLGPPESNGLGQLPESVEAYEKAAEIAEWMSQHDPSDRKSWFDLAVANMRIAPSLLDEPNGATGALRALTKAELLLARLTEADPSNQRYRFYAVDLDCLMGRTLMALGRDGEAIRRLERARSQVRNFRGGPNEADAKRRGIEASLSLGLLRAKSGDPAALVIANEAAADLSGAGPAVTVNRWSQAYRYAELGSLYLKTGQGKLATVWLEKSAAVWRDMTVPGSLEARRKKAMAAAEHDLAIADTSTAASASN
jgi:serine/threonine protein kinase/tetratricopeptide (TPR) repeat protein